MKLRAATVLLPALLVPAPAVHATGSTVTQTVFYHDPTPDPTGNAVPSPAEHCNGLLPQEAPLAFSAPAPGKLRVALGGFVGDWALQVLDPSGQLIGGTDVNPPDYEVVVVRLATAGTYAIRPCNLTGTFDATVTTEYAPS